MKPVYQNRTMEKDGFSNCFTASLASLLDLSLEEIAQALPDDEDHSQESWAVWLAERGYKLVCTSVLFAPKGFCMAVVLTDRVYPKGHPKEGIRSFHNCVAYGGKIVHDPYEGSSKIWDIQYFRDLRPLTSTERDVHANLIKRGTCRHGYKSKCMVCRN